MDTAVRTVLAEAGNQGAQGQAAVAAVLRNRAQATGATIGQEALKPNQFEPWNPGSGNDPRRFDPQSPQYQEAYKTVLPVLTGQADDPTGGATHFYAPKAQAALGRAAPSWDNGRGSDIGDHRFFKLPYGGKPAGPAQVASLDPSIGTNAPGATPLQGAPAAPDAAATPVQRVAQALPPGATAAPAGGIPPAVLAAVTNPAASPQVRAVATMMLQKHQAEQARVAEHAYQEQKTAADRAYQSAAEDRRYVRGRQDTVADRADQRAFESREKLLSPAEEAQKIRLAQASRSITNIANTNGGETGTLRKKLSEKEGDRWSSMLEGAATAGGMVQDLEVATELLKSAPQGPIAGKLAELFPGVTTAGGAFQALVSRVAPSLRTPGSGTTSDKDYEAFLTALPRLSNQPGANTLIIETIKNKAAFDIERGNIITAYSNNEIDENTARTKLNEMNKRSVMSPQLKSLLDGLGKDGATPAAPAPAGPAPIVANTEEEVQAAERGMLPPGVPTAPPPAPGGPMAAQAAPPQPVLRKIVGGKTYVKKPDGWYEE